jgi:hypothetical protein
MTENREVKKVYERNPIPERVGLSPISGDPQALSVERGVEGVLALLAFNDAQCDNLRDHFLSAVKNGDEAARFYALEAVLMFQHTYCETREVPAEFALLAENEGVGFSKEECSLFADYLKKAALLIAQKGPVGNTEPALRALRICLRQSDRLGEYKVVADEALASVVPSTILNMEGTDKTASGNFYLFQRLVGLVNDCAPDRSAAVETHKDDFRRAFLTLGTDGILRGLGYFDNGDENTSIYNIGLIALLQAFYQDSTTKGTLLQQEVSAKIAQLFECIDRDTCFDALSCAVDFANAVELAGVVGDVRTFAITKIEQTLTDYENLPEDFRKSVFNKERGGTSPYDFVRARIAPTLVSSLSALAPMKCLSGSLNRFNS